jgi:methionyl-tRNA formyltransferase
MRVVFMGSPEYAVKILDALNKNFEVVAVYTQPDKPVGRKKILTPTPVKRYAIENNLEVLTPLTLKNEDVSRFKPDFIVVAAYGLLLPKSVLDVAPCINLHASILPKYRGASPIQSAILNGDKFTGVTSMLMDEGLDTGDILVWDYTEVGRKTSVDLFEELGDIASNQIIYTLKNFSKIKPLPQIDAIASYARKIKKEDGFVDFSDALVMDRKYRAFKPWPGIFCDKFKINEMEFLSEDGEYKRGEILKIDKSGVEVGCERGKVKLIKVQAPGKKEVSAFDFVNGKRLRVGESILEV